MKNLEETTVEGSNPVQGNGKRKVADRTKEEQSWKMKGDPLLMKETLEIKEKRRKRHIEKSREREKSRAQKLERELKKKENISMKKK